MAIATINTQDDTDFYHTFTYKTAAAVPINITGAQLVMMVRKEAADTIALLRLGTDTGEIVVTDGSGGQFSVLITKDQLQEHLAYTEYVHSLIITLNGLDQRLWNGTLINSAGPSRDQ